MKQPDELFRLIKSMSKEEKRHFKMSSQSTAGEKTYLKLFDVINDAPNYDEASIKAKVKAGNFKSLKYTLFNTIIENLKNLHSSKSITNQIREDIESIDLLISRNILQSSKKLIQKNRQKALDFEHYGQFLGIINQQMEYDLVTSHKELTLEIIHRQQRSVDEVVDRIKVLYNLKMKIKELRYLTARKFPLDSLSAIPEKEMKAIEQKYADSFLISDTLFLYAFIYYATFKYDEKTANGYMSKSFHLLEKLKLSEFYPDRYLILMRYEGTHQLDNGSYDKVEEILQKFKNFKTEVPYLKIKQQFLHFSLSLLYYQKTKQYDKGMSMIKSADIASMLDSVGMSLGHKKTLCWRLAVFCFWSNEYKLCKAFLNHIIQMDHDLENRKILNDVSVFADFFKVIIAYEETDMDFIKYQSQMLLRSLEKKDLLFPFEKCMLLFFNSNASKFIGDKQKDVLLFGKLKKEVEAILPSALVRGVHNGFDFRGWIDSKIK